MNIWDHSRLSVRKFGGRELDYYKIHKFIDSSKLFYFHVKHRMLLHNLYGITLAIDKFGDYIQNSDKKIILIRDISAEHLKEDLNGQVPSLQDWLCGNNELLGREISIPIIKNKKLMEFVMRPLIMSNLTSSLFITLSDFGIYLTNEILGVDKALELHKHINKENTIKNFLEQFHFTERWQFSPDRKELEWLKNN